MSANDDLFDALVRHQIGLMRLSGSIRNRAIEILDATERDIARQIRERLQRDLPSDTISARRLAALERVIRSTRTRAWDEINELWLSEMHDLSQREVALAAEAARTVAPVNLQFAFPTAETLAAVVSDRPFEGRTLREWSESIARTDVDRIIGQVRIGVVQGETNDQIARRVVGTARLRRTDGVTEITRRNAQAITRTMTNAIANQARREFFKANASVFSEEMYVSTLDSRTTPICQSLDGNRYPIGEGPIPPLHFGCRSTRIAALDDESAANRPMKRSTQRQLLREYTRANNLDTVTSRGALPRGHRGAFDRFARGRVRELTGTTPANVNYETFLRRQSKEFQEDVLGKTKARLFRRGDLTLDKFVDRQGNELNLSELASRERQAFVDAGLDPDDF